MTSLTASASLGLRRLEYDIPGLGTLPLENEAGWRLRSCEHTNNRSVSQVCSVRFLGGLQGGQQSDGLCRHDRVQMVLYSAYSSDRRRLRLASPPLDGTQTRSSTYTGLRLRSLESSELERQDGSEFSACQRQVVDAPRPVATDSDSRTLALGSCRLIVTGCHERSKAAS
jgi:hypothetical protein